MNFHDLPNVPSLPYFNNQHSKIRRKKIVVENCINAIFNDTLLKAVFGENSELLHNLNEACQDLMYACEDEIDYHKTMNESLRIQLEKR